MSLRFRRYYKLFVALALVTLLPLGMGDQRIIAYTVDDKHAVQQAIQVEQGVAVFFDAVLDSSPALAAQTDRP